MNHQILNQAMRALQAVVPAGYDLIGITPTVQTGRRPHRWLAHYTRVDGVYRHGCVTFGEMKRLFERHNPPTSILSEVRVKTDPDDPGILVEYKTACDCTLIPRRRRSMGRSWAPTCCVPKSKLPKYRNSTITNKT